jgi:hypothetical protein
MNWYSLMVIDSYIRLNLRDKIKLNTFTVCNLTSLIINLWMVGRSYSRKKSLPISISILICYDNGITSLGSVKFIHVSL